MKYYAIVPINQDNDNIILTDDILYYSLEKAKEDFIENYNPEKFEIFEFELINKHIPPSKKDWKIVSVCQSKNIL